MKNSERNLLDLGEKLVKSGKEKGADQVQVSLNDGNDFSAEIRNGNIERLTEAGSRSLSLKVILDGKVATASSSDLREDTLNRLLANAIERAKLGTSDPCAGLPELLEDYMAPERLDMFDPKVLEMAPEEKIKAAREIERIALSDNRIRTSGGSYYGTNTGTHALVNSNGFSGAYSFSVYYSGIELQAGEGDNVYEEGWHESSIKYNGMKHPEDIAGIAVKRVTRMIGARKIPTQKVPVVMEPQMTASILGFFAQCISGGSIYMNQSFLVNKIGEKVANDIVNIVDDPLIPGALGSHPFDGEGVAARKNSIIENGVLKNYLLDTYSARKLKMKSTGHASGPTNLYLAAGSNSPEEIIKSVDKGLYLTRTIGQGTVPTTGDISKGAFGLWIENGELTYPVAEITFSGSLGNILKDITMIGNDLDFRRSVNGPTIKINEMTISGT